MTLYTYTVEGTDVFPVDMLRYDQAWPTLTATHRLDIATALAEVK